MINSDNRLTWFDYCFTLWLRGGLVTVAGKSVGGVAERTKANKRDYFCMQIINLIDQTNHETHFKIM